MEGSILVVEDDPRTQRLLSTQLTARGYSVQVVDNANAAFSAVTNSPPDVILLDIGLPDIDGIETCRKLREWSSIPVILVTCLDSLQTKIRGLDMGADDYVTKPFQMSELLARIRSVTRRSAAASRSVPPVVEVGDLRIDLGKHRVTRGAEEIALTRMQFEMVKELALNADAVLTYEHLLQTIWGRGYDDIRAVHALLYHLRKRIEPDLSNPRYIKSVPGIGYTLRNGE